jgi:hypothetical protein
VVHGSFLSLLPLRPDAGNRVISLRLCITRLVTLPNGKRLTNHHHATVRNMAIHEQPKEHHKTFFCKFEMLEKIFKERSERLQSKTRGRNRKSSGGYHFVAGYRYKKFRIRASVINGGTCNVEKTSIKNSSPQSLSDATPHRADE